MKTCNNCGKEIVAILRELLNEI